MFGNAKIETVSLRHQARLSDWLFYTCLLFFLAGFGLSVVSWMDLCTGACQAGHKYRLYGLKFEYIGLAFFSIITLIHILSRKYKSLSMVAWLMVAGATGAEAMFVYAQHYIIKHWCPICLCIAACVGSAFLIYAFEYAREFKNSITQDQRGKFMNSLFKGLTPVILITMGFLFSNFGFAKFNQVQAAEQTMKENIAFGNMQSPVEVYFFSDWECPSCRHVDPIIEQAAPEIMKKAKLIFVDFAVHDSSLNFTPYNLSFMIKNKPQYLKLRDALTEISINTTTPTDEQVEKAAKALGVHYQQLNYADVNLGIKYFKHLVKQFDVEGTPTVVIVNSEQKKGKKLAGAGEITQENIIKAIDSLK